MASWVLGCLRMPHLWGLSCPPPAQTGSPAAGPPGPQPFQFLVSPRRGTIQPMWATYCCISKSIASRRGEVIFMPRTPPSFLRLHLEYHGQFWIWQNESHCHTDGSSMESYQDVQMAGACGVVGWAQEVLLCSTLRSIKGISYLMGGDWRRQSWTLRRVA